MAPVLVQPRTAHIQYFSKGNMVRLAAAIGCEFAYSSHQHDGGEVFEAWLAQPDATRPFWPRLLGRARPPSP